MLGLFKRNEKLQCAVKLHIEAGPNDKTYQEWSEVADGQCFNMHGDKLKASLEQMHNIHQSA